MVRHVSSFIGVRFDFLRFDNTNVGDENENAIKYKRRSQCIFIFLLKFLKIDVLLGN